MNYCDQDFEKAKEHFFRGLKHILDKNWPQAEVELQSSLKYVPDRTSTLTNLCAVLIKQQRIDEARDILQRAFAIGPVSCELELNRGLIFSDDKDHTKAMACFDRAIALRPGYAEAWLNRGVVLSELRQYDAALESYDRAIALKSDYEEAWSNRGTVLAGLTHHEEALNSYARAIALNPNYVDATLNLGSLLAKLKRYDEALVSYVRAVSLSPTADFALGDLVHTQMKLCDWTDLESRIETIKVGLSKGERVCTPLPVLGLIDEPLAQKQCSEIYAKARLGLINRLPSIPKPKEALKIRLGYFSMDYREHPVAHLIEELIALHDRTKFEIYGYSFGLTAKDAIRKRLEESFDEFYEVGNLSDLDIAILSRKHKIDIAIDLGGYTRDSRSDIFFYRAAPVQINYLGFPGTMGSSQFDYIVGDEVVIDKNNRNCFFEKVIFLPNSFQSNPSQRPPELGDALRRVAYGIPDGKFVFCCFNNPWKITPETLDRWAQILRCVPESVMWIYADSLATKKNLRDSFDRLEINTSRLIFASQVSREQYFAQYQCADLFLDTLPYNAGTTASDALWVGLPVLTLAGKSFAARMAASLLHAAGLPELVTHSATDYVSKAVELGNDKQRITTLKKYLLETRSNSALFNASLFTRHLETAYLTAYRRHAEGLPVEHIHVSSCR